LNDVITPSAAGPVLFEFYNNSFNTYRKPAAAFTMRTGVGLHIGADTTKAHALGHYYKIGETTYKFQGDANLTISGDSVPQNYYGAWAFDIGTDLVVHTTPASDNVTGYASADDARDGLPGVAANHFRLAYITAKDTAGDFVPGQLP